LRTKDKKLDLAPEVILQEFARLQGDVPDTATFRLLGLRELHSHNSWMHNLRTLSAGRSQSLRIHPDDARRLGVEDGGHVHLDSAEARITVPVSLSTDMFPGNVALPHGWEHAGGWQRANEISGANYNTLAGRGAEGVEQLSGMSVLNGIPVTITKADGVSVPTIESHEPVVAVPAGRVP
jgi:anaerobic selenocysteine-containing dehydrogenase